MNFTSSQREAILCRGGSVLVSAGAGSGKTRVLTERLMAYIDPQDGQTPPESIDRFLVTSAEGNPKALFGRPVTPVTEFAAAGKGTELPPVVIALSRGAWKPPERGSCIISIPEPAPRQNSGPTPERELP